MKIVDIAYSPDAAGEWEVSDPADGTAGFANRELAMVEAMKLAKRQARKGADPYMVCVEGADGKWRLFDENMQPVIGNPALPAASRR
jgi:hypothetical protein